jgi:hypothetical protein
MLRAIYLLKDNNSIRIILAILLLFLPAALYFVPFDWLLSQHSICLYKNLTGHECYGCGMTRAIFSAMHFRFTEAFTYNRLYIIVLPLLMYLWVKTIVNVWKGRIVF